MESEAKVYIRSELALGLANDLDSLDPQRGSEM